MIKDFKLKSSENVEIFYSPHNEYINSSAKVVLVGITPGWQQMEIAFRTAITSLKEQESYEEACKKAKFAARMAGSMRDNLIYMLQEIGLHDFLKVSHVRKLFDSDCSLLHTTSLIRFPVFVSQENYNGHQPSLINHTFLYRAVLESFLPELESLNHPLIVPLGKSVERVLRRLLEEQKIQEMKILWGFPHPSGANGHRIKQFQNSKKSMQEMLCEYLSNTEFRKA
ncbi:hypothetical protein ABEW32_06835 [Paenibacillus jamilae]|uniref:hypothetical protein n=1 Tax=Paenibacillus jamilae TaxID=114136 RepID=UPI003D2B4C12